MKICMIADATSIHSLRWANYFVSQGDEVHIITYESPRKEVPNIIFHVVKSRFGNLYLDFIPRQLKISSIIDEIKPDILHAHFISKFGFHAAFIKHKPRIMSAWGSDILVLPNTSKFIKFFTKLSLKKADVIYAASHNLHDKIISEYNIPEYKVKYVPIGVDIDLFHPEEKKSETITILSNRNLMPVYNIETFINSISYVVYRHPEVRFIIAGSGILEDSLKEKVITKKLSEYVTFVGNIENIDMPKLLNECDIYVSTSLSDGTPISMMEAMACAKPCIISNVGGTSEYIENGVNGFLFTPKNYVELAEKIKYLIENPSIRKEFGEKALITIRENGDFNKLMKNMRKNYHEADLPQKLKGTQLYSTM
jgi:glycosyltransferase involved in cell wall biosynthesis